jgi:XTP/dITP diphosphohydrolase
MNSLLLATRNQGKKREMEKFLLAGGLGLRLLSLDEIGLGADVEESGGRPGVLSARYAGLGAGDDARLAKLLAEMAGIPDRSARFVSAVCLSRGGTPLAQFRGEVAGEILHDRRGTGGFGYDPLFFYPPLGLTFAEMPLPEKNRISHRARSLAQVRDFILGGGLG